MSHISNRTPHAPRPTAPRIVAALFSLLLVGLLAPAAPLAQEDTEALAEDADYEGEVEELAKAIEAILKGSDVAEGTVGIHVEQIASGRVLYSRSADEPMNPASNIKLITAAAALDKFGPQHTFETRLYGGEIGEEGAIDGSLYVRGSGEAFLLFEDLLDWAASLRQKGVRKIGGDIVIDDGLFDGAYLPPGFDQKDEDAAFRSPIGALSVNFNAVTAVVEPAAKSGEKPRCRLVPPNGHVELVNKAQTVEGDSHRLQLRSEPTDEGTRLVVEGDIGRSADAFRGRKRIDNPPQYAGSVLSHALQMVDIEFDGQVRTGQTPEGAERLVSHESHPLSWVIMAMNKWSNNFMAEQLLRTLGASDREPSTWDASREVVVDFLDRAGIDTDRITIHNGSGLYDGNLVSPKQFVALLRYMHDHRAGPEFRSSLAIAGTDGTLEDRLEKPHTAGNVRAKTGTLNEVAALSGYLRTRSGRDLAFSIIFNDPPQRAWLYRDVQDRIVAAIADFEG